MVKNEVFRVYAPNEKVAINTFGEACFKYRSTGNVEFQKYWDDLRHSMLKNEFTIIKNTDFCGIRKIT